MGRLISEEPFPGKEEVEKIISRYTRPNRSPRDKERFQSLEDAWDRSGPLSKWPSTFLDQLDATFIKHIVKPDQHRPFPNHLLEEGAGSIDALRSLWVPIKGAYHEELQMDVVREQHRLRERDITSGRVVEEVDAAPPSSLLVGAEKSYLKGMDGRLAFYFGHPERISFPLPTASMVAFLDASFEQSHCAIEEVLAYTLRL